MVPDTNYDLDDDSALQQLQLDPKSRLKIADEYCHYPKCDWAIVEYKSRSLKDCVKQLETTAQRLNKVGKKVDLAIIISKGMNSSEKHLFRKKRDILYSKINKKPVQIKNNSSRMVVNIYYSHEIEKQYKQYKGSLVPWVFR